MHLVPRTNAERGDTGIGGTWPKKPLGHRAGLHGKVPETEPRVNAISAPPPEDLRTAVTTRATVAHAVAREARRVRVISFGRKSQLRDTIAGTPHPAADPTPAGRGGVKPTAMLWEPWVREHPGLSPRSGAAEALWPSHRSAAPLRGLGPLAPTIPRLPEHRRGLYSSASFGGSERGHLSRRRLHAPARGAWPPVLAPASLLNRRRCRRRPRRRMRKGGEAQRIEDDDEDDDEHEKTGKEVVTRTGGHARARPSGRSRPSLPGASGRRGGRGCS